MSEEHIASIWHRNDVFVSFLQSLLEVKYENRCVIEVDLHAGSMREALYSIPVPDRGNVYIYLRFSMGCPKWFAVATQETEIVRFLHHSEQVENKSDFARLIGQWITYDEFTYLTESSYESVEASSQTDWVHDREAVGEWLENQDSDQGVTDGGEDTSNSGFPLSEGVEDDYGDEQFMWDEGIYPEDVHVQSEALESDFPTSSPIPLPAGHPDIVRELYWGAIKKAGPSQSDYPSVDTEENFRAAWQCFPFVQWLAQELPQVSVVIKESLSYSQEVLFCLRSGLRRCYILLWTGLDETGSFALAASVPQVAHLMDLRLSTARLADDLIEYEKSLLRRLYAEKLKALDWWYSQGPSIGDDDDDETGDLDYEDSWSWWEEYGGWGYELDEATGEWGYPEGLSDDEDDDVSEDDEYQDEDYDDEEEEWDDDSDEDFDPDDDYCPRY